MKDIKTVTYEKTEHEVVVNQDGEVTNETKRTTQQSRFSNEPPFVKLYLDHLSRFKGIQVSLNSILAEMLKYASFANPSEEKGGMLLFLNKPLKEIIAKKCGVSLHRVDNAVTEFVKKDYMRRLELGMYQFNPYFFGIGAWKDIANIRATFNYGTGEAVAEIVKNEEQKMNQATEKIASQSEEEIAKLKNKGA